MWVGWLAGWEDRLARVQGGELLQKNCWAGGWPPQHSLFPDHIIDRFHFKSAQSPAAAHTCCLLACPQRCEIKKTFSFVEFERLEDAKAACEGVHGTRILYREVTGGSGWGGRCGSGAPGACLGISC